MEMKTKTKNSELPNGIETAPDETGITSPILIIYEEPDDLYPYGNGSPNFEDKEDEAFDDELFYDSDIETIEELEEKFLKTLNRCDEGINEHSEHPDFRQLVVRQPLHEKEQNGCVWCSGTGFFRAGLHCGPCGGIGVRT